MTRRGDRRGFAIWLAFLAAMVVTLTLISMSPLEWSAGRDVAGGQLSTDTLAVARAAADELLLHFGRLANDPLRVKLFESLRSAAPGGALPTRGDWVLPGDAVAELASAGRPSTELLMMRLAEEGRKIEVLDLGTRITIRIDSGVGGWPPAMTRGLVTVEVTARGAGAGRVLERRIIRTQGMRIARLGLPWPFDRIALFVRDPAPVLEAAPDQVGQIMARLTTFHHDLGPLAASLPADPRATLERVRSLTADLLAAFESDADRVDRRTRSYLFLHGKDSSGPLGALLVGPVARTHFDRFESARTRLASAFRDLTLTPPRTDDLGPACEAFLQAADDFRIATNEILTHRWGGLVARDVAPDPFESAVGWTGLLGNWQGVAWYDLPRLQIFEALSPPTAAGPAAKNGVVTLPPGPTTVSDTELHGGVDGPVGRLVIVADGPVDVKDLNRTHGLLTVVAAGPITVTGNVRASLVALGGLKINDGAHIEGNVYVHSGPLELGPTATVDRERALSRPGDPASVFARAPYHVAMDPFVVTRSID